MDGLWTQQSSLFVLPAHFDSSRDFLDADSGLAEGVPDVEELFEWESAVGFKFELAAGVLFLESGEVGAEQAVGNEEGVEGDVALGIDGDDRAAVGDYFRRNLFDGWKLDLEDFAGFLGVCRDDHVNQENEEDVDQRKDRNLGAFFLDTVKMHSAWILRLA